jgi:3-(3-hydroxy-phenyl)propionate hydroxylase
MSTCAGETLEADVAVIGMGPVGATLANILGRRGVSVVAVDRDRNVHDRPRAVVLDHEAMRLFQNAGFVEKVLPHTVIFDRSVYLGPGGRMIKQLVTKPAPWALGWCPNYLFSQPAVDQVLREEAAARDNVEVRLGVEVVASVEESEGIRLETRDGSGTRGEIRARYAVACDGGASPTRRRLGIGFHDLDFDEPWIVVDALVDPAHLANLPATNVQYCEPERPGTHVIGPGTHRRWEIMLLPGEDPAEMQKEENIWRLLARWIDPSNARLWRAAAYRFHALVAKEWQRGRTILAGDAAHMTPPFLGQGMCQGLRDAANLAWKLEMVLHHGVAAERLLPTYETERAPHVRHTTEVAKALGRMICERDPEKAAARDAQMLAVGEGRIEYRQDLIPGLQDGLLSRRGGMAVGQLFPQPKVHVDGRELLLDETTGIGFRLICADPEIVPAAVDQRIARLGLRIAALGTQGAAHRIDEREGILAQWFADTGCRAALVRPDHYVFGTAGTRQDAEALTAELAAGIFGER